MPAELEKIVAATIERHRMLTDGQKVLVALSGGPDSVCLLEILCELRSKYSLSICVAHFNHRLRGEDSDKDARFAEKTARKRGLAFVSSSADVSAFAKQNKMSIETAGRNLRYDFLVRASATLGATRVAVGHTADDQAETILMRLVRGSGLDGLAGIPPVRSMVGGGEPLIIRPLIQVWKHDILKYLKARKLKFRKDVSNESPDYLRNRIRLDLLPRLEREYNPRIKERLAVTAAALAAEREFLDSEAKLLTNEMILERKHQWVLFHADLLAAMHPALRKRILSHLAYIAKPDAPMLEAFHHSEADALIRAGAGNLELPGRLRIEVSGGVGLISATDRKPSGRKGSFTLALNAETSIPQFNIFVKTKVLGKVSSPSNLIRRCTPARQYFDMDSVRLPLEVRARRPGDSFLPLGARGSKKLKDFFIDKKIPRFLRDQVPLLLSNGKIIWVMGHAIDRRFKLKPSSTTALRVDYEKRTPASSP